MILLHDVGTGDFFNVESFWPADVKASLEAVYHAFPNSPGSRALRESMEACPAYAKVEHRALQYPTQAVPGAVRTLRDHAILHMFPFVGSAFLHSTLDCKVPGDLPAKFDYVQVGTPFNGPPNATPRNMRPEEWPALIARLESRDTIGLVCNAPGGIEVPDHPRLLDWTGRTTMPQSIEVLKRASGYVGIDSCFAILAAQLFDTPDLEVRTANAFLVDHPWLFYSPRSDFSFLVGRFGGGALRGATFREFGDVVELRCNALVGLRNFTAGDRVCLPADRAAAMVAAGQAERVEAPCPGA